MGKKGSIFAYGFILVFLLSSACQESSSSKTEELSSFIGPEIDVNKIASTTVVNFKILKASTIGHIPQNRFYWVCINTTVSQEKIEELAEAIIREAITKSHVPYHSYTIHFFFEDNFKGSIENSKAVARANFLPEGGWPKVGHEPINNYQKYKLICKLVD